MLTVAGLLLAAGAGRRFGRPKALVQFDGKPLVERGIETLGAGGCSPVHVVLGAASADVVQHADLAGAVVVQNDGWPSGLASSLRAGIESLPVDVDAVVVALVDQPLVGAPVIRRLRAAHEGGAQLAVAGYHGQRGNPVLLARGHWAAVAEAAHDDVGARAYLQRRAADVVLVDCTDVGDPSDIDTPDDLAALEARVRSGPHRENMF